MLELVTKRDNFVKKNKINCIYCKSENVVSEGRQQYYCKNCEKVENEENILENRM